MNAGIVFQSNISIVQRYLLVDNTLMSYTNIWNKSKMKNRCPWCPNIAINVHGAPSSEYKSFF